MINLKNVKKVFVYFGKSLAKAGVFIYIFTYCNSRKSTVFFSPSVSNQMSLIVISVNYNNVAGGKQRGRLVSNNHC